MGILSWIVVGLVAGALAKLIMPGKDPGGIIVTILMQWPYSRSVPLERWIHRVWPGFREA